MTSWSGPGSAIRYYQCPFCARTHSSQYGEVFQRGAGARLVDPRPEAPAGGIPEATPEAVRWASIKASAARWFARLDADQRRLEPAERLVTPLPRVSRKGPALPLMSPRRAIQLAPARVGRRKA